MNFWRINTDCEARKDIRTCDLWYDFGMAFTGDFQESSRKHYAVFSKVSPGDGIFMHHSGLGIVGYGYVKEKWDHRIYERNDKLLYLEEPYEYRIAVSWDITCDCRENPLPINGRLPHKGTYCHVDIGKWDVQAILNDLRDRSRPNNTNAITNQNFTDNTVEFSAGIEDNSGEVSRILSKIGQPVSFKYPGNEGDKHGILQDRVVIESSNEPGAVPYWDVVDLIRFEGEKEPEWIRIGYYRKPGNTLNWGSQTTITEPISVWKRILFNAAKEKEWFRNLLKEALNELEN